MTPNADTGATCDDVLVLPATAEVRVTCVLDKGHDGLCRSADGRRWSKKT